MSNPFLIALAPTTSAQPSSGFYLAKGESMSVVCAGLMGGETGTVQVLDPLSGNWYNYWQEGLLVQFTSSIVSYDAWDTQGTFRVNKSISSNPVGVAVIKSSV